MELTLLTVPACPNAALFEERLAAALTAHPGTVVHRRVITDEREAADAGMHGSPTLLVDGTDPFAPPGQPPSLSGRLGPDRADAFGGSAAAGAGGAGRCMSPVTGHVAATASRLPVSHHDPEGRAPGEPDTRPGGQPGPFRRGAHPARTARTPGGAGHLRRNRPRPAAGRARTHRPRPGRRPCHGPCRFPPRSRSRYRPVLFQLRPVTRPGAFRGLPLSPAYPRPRLAASARRADRGRPGRERSALPTRAARLGPAQNIPFGVDAAGPQLSVTAAQNGGYACLPGRRLGHVW